MQAQFIRIQQNFIFMILLSTLPSAYYELNRTIDEYLRNLKLIYRNVITGKYEINDINVVC